MARKPYFTRSNIQVSNERKTCCSPALHLSNCSRTRPYLVERGDRGTLAVREGRLAGQLRDQSGLVEEPIPKKNNQQILVIGYYWMSLDVMDVIAVFCGGTAIPYKTKARVATDIVAAFPQRALSIIRGGAFEGGDLVILKSEIHRPSFQDRLETNFCATPQLQYSHNQDVTQQSEYLKSRLNTVFPQCSIQ